MQVILLIFKMAFQLMTMGVMLHMVKVISQPILAKHEKYELFSTDTSYDVVRGNIQHEPGCDAIAIWSYMRHGIRYPTSQDILNFEGLQNFQYMILENHKNNRGQLTEEKLEFLRKWSFKVSKKQSMKLTPSGKKELEDFGKRLRNAFPHMFNSTNHDNINIKRTRTSRTKDSAASLYRGIFNQEIDEEEVTIDDAHLWLEKSCKLGSQSGTVTFNKLEEFKSSQLISQLVEDVSRRLGFKKILRFDYIEKMYYICGFEKAWYKNSDSAWCSVFTTKELKMFEFMDDLRLYWSSGFGNPFTLQSGCYLMRDMITQLKRNKSSSNVHFNFGHEQGIRSLLVSLRIGDCPNSLTVAGYLNGTETRDCWRTSKMVPFGANIISVLYSCGKEQEHENFKIGLYLNEKLIPICEGQNLCPFQQFIQQYSYLVYSDLCKLTLCS